MPRLERFAAVEARIHDVIADPASSFWLKQALAAQLLRDPVDAASDAALLRHLLEARCAALFADVEESIDQPQLPFIANGSAVVDVQSHCDGPE